MNDENLRSSVNGTLPGTWRNVLVGVGLLAAGLWLGSAAPPPSAAWAEIRTTPTPETFQSGGQQSVPILKEIAATLHQMDARLSRLEVTAKLMQKQMAGGQSTSAE